MRIRAKMVKQSYLTSMLLDFPKFDGPLPTLKNWMQSLGWSYVDEYGDHLDFYGEGRNGFLKVTWKKVKDRLWKSVKIEDAKFPLGQCLKEAEEKYVD